MVKVHVLFDDGKVDHHVLAHELGHAVWIATGQQTDIVREAYDCVQDHPEEKFAHLRNCPPEVREAIVREEEGAWRIARELLADEEHDPTALDERERAGLESYREDLLGGDAVTRG